MFCVDGCQINKREKNINDLSVSPLDVREGPSKMRSFSNGYKRWFKNKGKFVIFFNTCFYSKNH